jgi:formate hydrogenlyase subunit 6/NADH:ubiquinone oxidoreductase subunit I
MIKTLKVLREIARGAAITGRHFFVNMTFHTLRLFGIRTKRQGAVTIQYPEVKKALSPRHHSLHRIRPLRHRGTRKGRP